MFCLSFKTQLITDVATGFRHLHAPLNEAFELEQPEHRQIESFIPEFAANHLKEN